MYVFEQYVAIYNSCYRCIAYVFHLLLAIVVNPMDQSIWIITGLEMTRLMCVTQGIADRVEWERQDNEPLPIGVTTSYMSLTSTLSITNINDTNVGGRYRCVAYFSGQPVPSSYAFLNVTGEYTSIFYKHLVEKMLLAMWLVV